MNSPWGGVSVSGPSVALERVTIFGLSHFKQLTLATEVIFTEPVIAEQRHEGCVRFSYVPTGSRTPRRYRCQPDWQIRQSQERAEEAKGGALTQPELDAIAARVRAWLVPSFTAEDYGLPAYAQLRMSSPVQLRTGAEDGSEMGAFCHLKQAQRLTNLRIRLDEYLPFGLVPGFTFVT